MSEPMFYVPETSDNAEITLNDNAGVAPSERWIIGRSLNAKAWAVMSYARKHGIHACRVGYSIKET